MLTDRRRGSNRTRTARGRRADERRSLDDRSYVAAPSGVFGLWLRWASACLRPRTDRSTERVPVRTSTELPRDRTSIRSTNPGATGSAGAR